MFNFRIAVIATATALAALAGVLGAPAQAETRPPYGGKVVAALLSEPVQLDPVQASSHAEVTLVSLLFDTLYRVDDQGQLVPHVAAALPATARKGRELRIPIRPGITFHDGTPLEPVDVVRSLRRLARGQAGWRWQWLLAPVREVVRRGQVVVVRLRRPVSGNGLDLVAWALAAPATSITPRGRAPQRQRPIGSGPFAMEQLERDRRRVVLTAADTHFAGRPYLDTLELRWFEGAGAQASAYEVGTLQLSLRGAVAYAGHKPKYETHAVTGAASLLAYVGFGKQGALRTQQARLGLSLALERDGFRGIGTGERVEPTVFPAPLDLDGPATPPAARRARLDQARQALVAAARSDGRLRNLLGRSDSDDPALSLIIDRSRPDDREIAEKVVAALFRLGLSARIDALPAREFARRVRRGQCDLYIGQLALPVPSSTMALVTAFAAGGDSWARTQLSRGSLDAATARARFAQSLPIVPLFHRAVRVHHRSDLRGVTLDATARLGFADLFLFGPTRPSR